MRLLAPRVQAKEGGGHADAGSGETFETINPATGEVICELALADEEDVNRAVESPI